ncbi:MAG TPA: TonB-dependent receptor [Terriglobia bacterium]|nr:TonB-dependent receptor [Terriglobia bacterium]
MSNRAVRTLTLFVLVLTVSRMAGGQSTAGSVSGVVTDQQDRVMPGVAIQLENLATGVTRKTVTDNDGRYSVLDLKPGGYELRAVKQGFKTYVQSSVGLAVAEKAVMDLGMTVGGVGQEIMVADRPLIETSEAGMTDVVGLPEIQSLPNFGRNFVDFVKLDTGVHLGRENVGGGAFKEPDSGVGISAVPRLSFGGQSELNTMVQVDGADNVQTFTGLPRATPSQEAAQEFRVLNSTYLAEYGRSLGGFVNIVTKSGGNDTHGSLYYFGSNNALNALPLLAQPDAYVLRHNQFGATVGGAAKKDRTFFFLSYEGQRHDESNNFAQFLTPATVAAVNRVLSQFPGLTPETLNQVRTANDDQGLAKLDQVLSDHHRLSVRYNYTAADTLKFPGGGGRDSVMSSAARNATVGDQALLADDTVVISPRVVNEAWAQWARRRLDYAPLTHEPALEVSNLLLIGKTYSDFDSYREDRLQLSDSLLDQVGSHTLKVGVSFNRLIDDSRWDLFFPARIIFSSVSALLQFSPASKSPVDGATVFWWPILAGANSQPAYATSWTSDVPPAWQNATLFHFPYNAYGFFAQDQWRVRPQFSVTYGLRWDFETYPRPFVIRNDLNNLQPRVGVAYSPRPTTVVRAGFGVFTDRVAGSVGQVFDVAQAISRGNQPGAAALFPGVAPVPGLFDQATVTPSPDAGAPTAAALSLLETGAVPQPSCLTQTLPACVANLSVNKDGAESNPFSYQASLQVSRQVGKELVLNVGYLYVRAPNLLAVSPNLNAPLSGSTEPDGTPIDSLSLSYPALGDFFVSYNAGFSDYHGGTAEVEKRYGRHFGLHASYTYSKTISNVDSISNLGDFPQTSLALEKALSRQDMRHRFVLAFMSTAPAGVRPLRGLKFDALITAQSGTPYTIYTGKDLNNDGNPLSDRPGYPAGSPGCPAGGPLGRNSDTGPGLGDVDLRLGRDFRLKESVNLELTLDAFNAFNRVNIKDLNTTCGSGNVLACPNAAPQSQAGFTLPALLFSPRDVFNAREIQYAAKLRF